MATYEIVLPGGPGGPAMGLVPDLPPAEIGEVIFYQGSFWRVDAIKAATSQEADRRLVVTRVTEEPKRGAA